MKKFFSLLCMITCIFGLTACGSEEKLTEYETYKLEGAKQKASQNIIPLLQSLADDERIGELSEYTKEELEYVFQNSGYLSVDGASIIKAMDSFQSAMEVMGEITAVGEATAEFDDDQIIVYVQVSGANKNAEAEIILSNDMFMKLESASLNPISSMGELMGKAALNTLLGMGTVFLVLILISLIIYCFSLIPKIQSKLSKKNNKEVDSTGIDNAVAQIAKQEESRDETDDLELVAVIAAAIAASEGAASTDGFVVRSIRKVNKGRV